ncbi:Putative formate dehydrogenase oxidoreductase protein [hydrothermal vent metagenome]|uniref:Formate dehydrogenase oxidoreductase protein n=1 Tax=hydrothermal vent metagenome TaxID=652676 RepID=A0A3B1DUR3_9ZZZZ
MKKPRSAGGWAAIKYSFKKASESGGALKFWKALRSKNACKTCALGMGGQKGGMVNELGHFPEVCKKSMQAMAADMQQGIDSDFWKQNSIEQLRAMSPRELEHSGRLVEPVLYEKGATHYRPISWEEAQTRIANKLKSTVADETFWYFSGRSSNEASFLLQLFARIYGTNNVNNCSYYCHQASGVGLTSVTGSGTATIVLNDVEHADLVFVIGGNPASNHPRLLRSLMNVRRRGGEVIVINPAIELGMVNFRIPSDMRSLLFGSSIASLYVQPHIGGDLALLAGIAKRIDEMGATDKDFLKNHCDGWDDLAKHLHNLSWEEIVSKSGVSQEEIDCIAEKYAKAKNVIFSWTMGITHHLHGVQNVQAIANLAMMRGMAGKQHAGLMPIRGHSNVQGIGSMGVTPQLKEAIFERLQSHYDIELPTSKGLDTMGCMEAADAGDVSFGFCLGGNLYGSNPDLTFAEKSLSKLSMLCSMNTTLNTGHAFALAEETILLPVLARDEEPQPSTQESMFNFVRLSEGGPRRHKGPRSEVEVIAEIASSVLGKNSPVDWNEMRQTSSIRTTISTIVPGWEKIENIDQTKEEFQIAGRTFHKPTFATPNGRAQLHVHDLPELSGDDKQLRLMTIRSEGQFNTVVYEEYDLYRGQDRRDIILMHPDDIQRLGVQPEQQVAVCSDTGRLESIYVRPFKEIRAGNAMMYFPEANRLVSRALDPQSKTPAYKNVLVWLENM